MHPEQRLQTILGDLGFEHLRSGQFETALEAFEHVLRLGTAPPVILLAYAICASELGEPERAQAAQAALPIGFLDDPRFEEVRRWLPGGRLSRGGRNDLAAAAERWLPRAPRGAARPMGEQGRKS